VLFSLFPVVSLAHNPTPLRAVDGRDLSFLLKRYDGPVPILREATKGRRHIVPRTLQVEEVPVRRALTGLVERQQCVDPGYVPCPGSTQCCPTNTACGPGNCCPLGGLTCAGNCCPDATGDCCPNVGCCPGGQVCFTAVTGNVGCCPMGQTCTTISGCADHTAVECPGETFCCPAGTTCGRDANSNATCLDKNGLTITTGPAGTQNGNSNNAPNTIANAQTTKTQSANSSQNTNNSPSFNPFKKSAALPRVAVASGLMVPVAFLGAFLL